MVEIGQEYFLNLGFSKSPVQTKVIDIDDNFIYVKYIESWFDREDKFKIEDFEWLIGEDDETDQ